MSTTLLQGYNNSYQVQANALCGTPNRVKVIVEDELDVSIWHVILRCFRPKLNFDISAYANLGIAESKGKGKILTNTGVYGSNYIACVDSDYDWLIHLVDSDRFEWVSHPYILHTGSYAIENLLAHHKGHKDLMVKATKSSDSSCDDIESTINHILSAISPVLYPLIIWAITLQIYSTNQSGSWNKPESILSISHFKSILSKNKTVAQIINDVLYKVSKLGEIELKRLSRNHQNLICNFKSTEKKLSGVLTPQNSWLFVRGHDLHEFLYKIYLKRIESDLKKKNRKTICNCSKSKREKKDRIAHYNSSILNLQDCIYVSDHFLTDPKFPLRRHLSEQVSKAFPPATFYSKIQHILSKLLKLK